MLLLITLINSLISVTIQYCGYTDYDSTIIQYPYQEEQYAIIQHTPYGVGFWSKYIAYDELNNDIYEQLPDYGYFDRYFQNKQMATIQGRQLLIIYESFPTYKEINMILTLHSFDPSVTIHRLYYKVSGYTGSISYIDLQYDTERYEGYWIFTYIGFYPDAQIFEYLTFGYSQYGSGWLWGGNKFIKNQYYGVILGGKGEYYFKGNLLKLERFLGKFSTQIQMYEFFWDFDTLMQFISDQQCFAYNQCQGYLQDNFIDLMEFDGTNDVSFQKYIPGNSYYFSFWLKLDYSKVIRTSEMLVLRATTNSLYGNNTKIGDRAFYIRYLINFPDNGTVLTLSAYHYSIPDINSEFNSDNFIEVQVNEEWLTQLAQYWHKIQYFQQYFTIRQYVDFYFPQSADHLYYAGLDRVYNRQLLHTMMYFHFGVDHYQSTQKLQGTIAKFRLFTCIEDNDLTGLGDDCDKRCSSCSGPTQYDCIDCAEGNNRFYFSYNTTCQCQIGYIDNLIDAKCQKFNEVYQIIKVSEIEESIYEEPFKCPFSKLQNNRIGCLDCLQNRNTWHTKQICTKDLLKYKSSNIYSPYFIQTRDSMFFDVYTIQNDEPLLCVGCLTICENSEDCQLSQKGFYIQCKSSYYLYNGECIKCPNQCKSCSSTTNCLECFDSYYLNPIDITCYECQENCKSCSYSILNKKPICTSCYEKQSLFEGICYNCGTLCSACVFDSYQFLGETIIFNRCLKCDEPGKHFRSLDGVNCQINSIPSCLDAFQYQTQEIQSLDYLFIPQVLDETIQIICARCDYGYVYDPILRVCYYQDSFIGKSFFYDATSEKVVVISGFPNQDLQPPQPYELLNGCVLNGEPIQYCRYCIYSNTYNVRSCSLCDSGYYAERIRGICLPCQIKNCRICTQQMKIYEDAYMWQIKAFYEYFVNKNGQHSFDEYAQSQNEADYEVICTLCYEGYETIDGKCVKKCHKLCNNCELVNYEYRCLQCFTNQQGQALTIVNNECIECPFNCALCTIRSDIDIYLINPYFSNSVYQYFSYLCLLPYSGMENYYYDNLLGQYIKCDTYKNCFKSWTIERNLICSDSDYDQQFALLQSTYEKNQFDLNNKKLSSLFSNTQNISHLSEFENDFVYLEANQQGIKQIILRYYLDAQEGCVLQQNAYYAQYFSQNIFSAINVHFELIGRNNPSLTFYGDFKLINFTSIQISNITIYSDRNLNTIKYFEFSSQNRLVLQLINLQFIQIEDNPFQLIWNNISSINITKTLFQVRIQNDKSTNKYFIHIQSSKSIKVESDFMIFNQITLSQCIFNQSEFVYYNSSIPLIFTNSGINQSQFNKFTLLNVSSANITISNIEMLNIIMENCPNFISIDQNTINLDNVSITGSQIQDSVWLSAGYQVLISNLKLNNLILSNSILIELINSIQNINFSLFQSNFTNIYYYNQSKLLRIQDNFQFLTSFINFTDVVLENNTQPQQQQSDDNVIKYFNSLIIVNSTNINMNQITINRGIGVNEFALLNTQNLKITNLIVNLIDSYKIKSLHQYFDCIQDQIYENKYGTMIYVIGGAYSYLENIVIQNLIIIDQPLIQFLTLINFVEPKQETIILKNSTLQNNLLLITQLSKTVSIIFIDSMQIVSIYISSTDIIHNHFNGYISEQNSLSTSTLTINCPQSNLSMVNINLSSNLNTNSTNQIMIIIVQTIYFKNSYVNDNNQITVQFILPNLYHGFAQNNLTLNNYLIKKLFPVLSYGTFKFSVQRLQIDNVALSNSFGSLGTCFTILTEKLGIIQILNSKFYNISDGGCIYIDSTPTNLDLTVNNILFESIFNSQEGGAISIRPTTYSAKISIFNITAFDTYAISGSLLNSQFYSSSQNKMIQLDTIKVYDQQSKFFNYLLIFVDFTNSLQELQTNSYIINIKNSNYVNISNVYFQNIMTPRMFNIIEGKITFFNISIIDTENVIQGFFIQQSNEFDWLYLEQISIRNQTSYSSQNNQSSCESSLNNEFQIHMICKTNNQLSISIDQQFQKNNLISIKQCRASMFTNQIPNLDSYINIEMTGKSNHSFFNNMIFQNNNVSQFSKGLIYLQIAVQEITLEHIVFENNICSQYGCLSISNSDTSINNRLLQKVNQVIETIPLKISQMNCIKNYAINGVCIYISNLSALIKNSYFVQNVAEQYGGAIFIQGKNQIFLIGNSIFNNQAQIGGALYNSQGQIDSKILIMNIIDANSGIISNNNIYQYPSQVVIQIKFNEIQIRSTRLFSNQSFTIDQLDYNQIGTEQYIKMPSGIEIEKYAIYNQANQTYSNSKLCFLIYVADQFSNLMFTSKESECKVKSRTFSLQKAFQADVDFQDEKLVTLESVYFDPVYNYYNFGKLIFLFDPDSNVNELLQLQFQCDSILVAQYNESNNYEVISYSNHYYYRINIRTLPCQIGEIKNLTTLSCQICDSSSGFFQVRQNQSHCLLMDNGIMLNNTSSNFQLRTGYWRESYQNIILDQCSNNLENCLGGWNYSDNSCLVGHIGALCEECDLYNTRGQGQFSSLQQYRCGTCKTIQNNLLLWVAVSIWTIVSVGITVKATFDFGYSLRVNRNVMRIALLLANESCSGGILIKFLSTYLQIVGSLSTFQLTLPSLFSSIMNTTANPLQAVSYSLDCFLANAIPLQIVYSRILWQLMMPLVCIVFFFIGFAIIIRDKVILMKNGLIITGMIYIYIFLQPNLIGSIISVIAFRVVDGFRWIQGHMAYRYDTAYHYHILYFLFGILFIIGILIPLTLLYKLYKNRNKLNRFLIRNLYGYLYNEYIDKAYFWELVKLGLKDVIIFFLTFYQDQIFLKAVIIYLMLQIYVQLSQYYKPHRLHFLNQLDYEMCLNCQISIIIGLGLSLIQKQQINSAEIPFILILGFINCLFLYKILTKLFEVYLTKFQVYIDLIKEKIRSSFPNLNSYRVCQISLQNRTAAKIRAKKNFRKLYHVMMTVKVLNKHQHLSTEV